MPALPTIDPEPDSVPPPHPPHPLPLAPALVVRTTGIDAPEDLLALLPRPSDAFAWTRRGDGFVAWGEAARIVSTGPDRFARADAWFAAVVARAEVEDEVTLPGTGLVALGSFAFADASPAGGSLVIPRVVVGRREGRAWLTTIEPAGTPHPRHEVGEARGRVDPVTVPDDVTWSDGSLTATQWLAAVTAAVARIRSGEAAKVVLARDLTARSSTPLDPRALLARFADAYPMTWTFAVDGLVGATPELLVRRERGLVASRVLAGTIRRTGDDEADLAHAAALARSSKDLEEHELAVASLSRALAPYVASANVPETPSVLHLPNVMHLATDVTGVLATRGAEAPSSLALAAALHPTAAVGGTPTDVAVRIVAELEGMERGRYAGPVGWLGADGDGEWCIALRCTALDPDDPHRARVFAGCGIVAASQPAAELAEAEAKLEPVRQALLG